MSASRQVIHVELTERKVMITGGAGFIGSHLTYKLLELENEVFVYDNFDDYYTGKRENLKKALKSTSLKLIEGDILDHEKLSASMSGVDVVFHLAAQPGVRFSAKNPWKTNKVNVEGTLNVLLSAKENDVKRVVFASSSSVYGVSNYLPWDEKHPTSPISVYGASKLAAEKYCQTFYGSYKLPIVVLRYHTVYGPRQRPDMAIRRFAEVLSQGRSPVIYGDGKQTRDFTYVSDAVDGTVLAAESRRSIGEIFNLGSGTRVAIEKILVIMQELMGKHHIPPIYQSPKAGDVPDTYADIKKAQDILEYNPETNIEQGLKATIDWYKSKLDTEKPR